IPPHKQNQDYTHTFHRVQILNLAIQSNPSFNLHLLQIQTQPPSYTFHTLSLLKHHYPNHHLFFIIPPHMIQYFPKCYNL
ncbi:nicotinate-nicotinamide nucleotide adenylyltransferase, partial [Bacillus subtilis]|uniref:nicotinate-nicotinamide nucleotide adenylyltransferase n=1 Tax=Bacillus subtilis TaxID=1423 RepID=UPI003DA8680A